MKSFIAILLFVSACLALGDISVPVTFQDSAIIEAADFNANFDTLEAWAARTNDSLDAKFMRWSDLTSGDSTISMAKFDSIKGNVAIDSIDGPTVISGKLTTDSLNLGESSLNYYKRGSFTIHMGTGICTADTVGTCYYTIVDSMVYLSLPSLMCTSDSSDFILFPNDSIEFPAEILPSDYQFASVIIQNTSAFRVGVLYFGANNWSVLNGSTVGSYTAGQWTESGLKGLPYRQTVTYRLR